jgi:hypothetical protein
LSISRAGLCQFSSLSAGPFFFASLIFIAAAVPAGRAQEAHALPSPQPASTTATSDLDEMKVLNAMAKIGESESAGVPYAPRGFTGGFTTSTQHDSSNGWSSQLIPFMAYRVCRFFSMDVSTLLYTKVKVDANIGTKAKPVYAAVAPKSGAFGDTTLSFHGNARAFSSDYTGTFSLGLPSGNRNYGLGAGQVTYSINHRFENTFGLFTPDIEIGFGDTSSLVNQNILKSYVSVGPMAHFQAGTSIDLPLRMNFSADAYEELPLDNNLIYSTTGSGKKKVTTATNIDPGEDNGFITSLDIPLSHAVTMSGFYSRSLRDHTDIAGFSFTFVLATPPRPPEVTP